MKGIPNSAILAYCKQNKLTPIELYEKLFNGESVKFDLCSRIETDGVKQFT